MRRIAWVAAAVGVLLLSSTAALAQRGDDKATLVLESQPAGVDILIDGDSHGLTPRSVEVKAGAHEVKLVKEGLETYTKKVKVKPGEKLRLKGTLKPAVAKAKGKPALAKGKEPAAKEAAKVSADADKGAREAAKDAARAEREAEKVAAKAAKEEARKARAEAKEAAKAADKEKGKEKARGKEKANEKPALSKGPTEPAAAEAKGSRDVAAEAKGARDVAADAKPVKHDLPHADMDDRTKAAKATKADDDLRATLIDDPVEAEPTKRPAKRPPKPADADGAAAVTAPPATSASAVPVAPVTDRGGSSGPSLRTIGWIGLGVGLALTGGAIYTNVLTNQRYDALTKAGKDRNGLTVGTSQVDARASMDKANTFRTVSSVLYVVGGTAVGVSAFLVAFGDSDWSTNGLPAVAVSPLPGGGVFSVQGGF
jgi:hypothetical protein